MCSSSECYVTLATRDNYALGALVLAKSLRQVGSKKSLVVMISSDLSSTLKNHLEENFDEVILVEELNSNQEENLRLLSRPELGVTFTKFNCWLLEKYSKCVFLDADIVVLRNIDDLFEREEFSAAPDAGWPDCFNSGVFVFRPSKETFRNLVNFANEQNSSFDGGDQGLLNRYFSHWRTSNISHHLPFTYNVTSNTFYSYLPAITRYRDEIRVVHFAGSIKPWDLTYNTQTEEFQGNVNSQNEIQLEFLRHWWKILTQHVLPQFHQTSNSSTQLNFSPENRFGEEAEAEEGGGGGNLSWNGRNFFNPSNVILGSVDHRRAWESGNIDYQGRDSFTNILQQLDKQMQNNSSSSHPSISSRTNLVLSSKEVPSSSSSPSPSTTILPRTSTLESIDSSGKSSMEEEISFSSSSKEKVNSLQRISSTSEKKEISSSSSSSSKPVSHDDEKEKEKEGSWIVKSTIITAHTQGIGQVAGITKINKFVSESSSSDEKLIDHKSDEQNLNRFRENRQAKKSFENCSFWLIEKFFTTITYFISLCYLFFLLFFRRYQKNESISVDEKSLILDGMKTSSKHLHEEHLMNK